VNSECFYAWFTSSHPCLPPLPLAFSQQSGRNKHIWAKHNADGREPQESSSSSSPSPLPSPVPSSLQQPPSHESHDEQPLSPILSDPIPPPSPSHGGPNADVNMDIKYPNFDRDETPPGSYFDFGQGSNRNSPPGDGAEDQHIPDPPCVTRAYHPKLNGKSSVFSNLYIH
jgi:hypothetical protein